MTERQADRGRSVVDQIKRNSVAYISLFVALSSLAYNTWRNETTEQQRNIRHAAFELVDHLERFQSIVNAMVYPAPRQTDRWVDAWGEIKSIETLGQVLPAPMPVRTSALVASWNNEQSAIRGADRAAAQAADARLSQQINATREAVVTTLRSLD